MNSDTRVQPLQRSIGPFLRAERGSVAVEFAMVGTAFLLFLFGTLQVMFYLYVAASMEDAVAKATRQVMTGAVTSGSMTADQFRTNVLCPILPSGLSCSSVITNLVAISQGTAPNGFYQYVNSNQSWVVPPTMNNAKTSFCTGVAGSVIYAQAYYAMPVFIPLLLKWATSTWQNQSVMFVGAFAAFRNEPFQSSAQGAC